MWNADEKAALVREIVLVYFYTTLGTLKNFDQF